jgi:uncharacterized protein (UPF0332 family)
LKEIESLLKRSDRYLLTAKILIKEGDFESSVSRTYYAMFFAAQAMLLSKKLSYSSHKMTISGFGENFIKTNIFPKEMGREFNRAFDKRQLSDYYHTFIIDKKDAEDLLKSGKIFVDTIKNYLFE